MGSTEKPSKSSRRRPSKPSARKSTPNPSKSRKSDTLVVRCAKVAADLIRSFAIIKPPERLRISEWARKHARLKDGSRYHPWPFQIEMLDELNNPRTSKVTVMKAARVGYTQILLAFIGYRIAHDPANVLMARPTIEDARKFMKEHIAEVLKWPIMKSLGFFRAVAGTATDTTTEKYFPGGSMKGIGANSPGGFRDHDADVALSDEVDGFPVTAGVDGDQLALIAKRLAQSYDPKDIAGSTPTEESISKIYRRFQESDQRFYHCPCPTCGTFQKLVWGNGKEGTPGIKWTPFKNPEKVYYECVNGCEIPESKKLSMLQNGKWVADHPEVYERTGHAGFHVSAIYSLQPNGKWPKLIEEFVESYKSPLTFKTFVNTVLGEVWKFRGEAPDWKRLSDRRNEWKRGIVPFGGCFLTAAVDVQAANGGRLECFVWAHGRGGSTWLVEHREFMGSPFEMKVWDELALFVKAKYPHENGTHMLGIEKLGVDTGYATRFAYNFCRRMGLDWAMPLKGSKDLTAPPIAASKSMELATKQGSKSKTEEVRVHNIGGHILKQEFYALLRLDRPAPDSEDQTYPLGYVHLPTWLDVDTLKELVAEEWIEDRAEWRATGPNEALDCWLYSRAMAIARGCEKWSDAEWTAMEAIFGPPGAVIVEEEPEQITQRVEEATSQKPALTVQKPRKKAAKSSWLHGGR